MLKIMLLCVNSVLNDAGEKQIRNPAVKEWVDDLEEAALDADDRLDGIATDASQFKLETEQSRTGTGKVSKIVPNCLINFFDPDMEIKMEEIFERLEIIAKQKDVVGLKEGFGEKTAPRIATTSLVEETEVFGGDGDKKSMIKWLRDDDEGSKKFVIPILGMGGVGKTTLAQ
ncbi:putative disease resistance RPP13-like protein 1 [Ziziphus jujuba]|uniref:Disease resistance RPP13-like protein 1 n=1 Tax=Ziziphus jujuba TaxID=326968 RepID=A0ABM4A4I8_ZIZJJ|nr:putative disease resistance RPP13-like protein 1 [Ziziphus jujuba]